MHPKFKYLEIDGWLLGTNISGFEKHYACVPHMGGHGLKIKETVEKQQKEPENMPGGIIMHGTLAGYWSWPGFEFKFVWVLFFICLFLKFEKF